MFSVQNAELNNNQNGHLNSDGVTQEAELFAVSAPGRSNASINRIPDLLKPPKHNPCNPLAQLNVCNASGADLTGVPRKTSIFQVQNEKLII